MKSDTSSQTSSSSSDFRTAVIENHWNDPPKKIFHKSADHLNDTSNVQDIANIISTSLTQCKSAFTTGPQKRIVDDTARRIEALLKQLENNEFSDEVVRSLHDLSQALESKEYAKALTVQTKLMTTEYDKHGNWITGLKRLIDLTEKASA
ncbi:hypothetical protein HPULCUR_002454 [Helicostylum pulchrum]|uniref:SRA1/Sec31 domain-containing protein n=1 Tax=Helicostylum pulchrum TaxID=562976 RepID=A0ABP9XS11_9FUNG